MERTISNQMIISNQELFFNSHNNNNNNNNFKINNNSTLNNNSTSKLNSNNKIMTTPLITSPILLSNNNNSNYYLPLKNNYSPLLQSSSPSMKNKRSNSIDENNLNLLNSHCLIPTSPHQGSQLHNSASPSSSPIPYVPLTPHILPHFGSNPSSPFLNNSNQTPFSLSSNPSSSNTTPLLTNQMVPTHHQIHSSFQLHPCHDSLNLNHTIKINDNNNNNNNNNENQQSHHHINHNQNHHTYHSQINNINEQNKNIENENKTNSNTTNSTSNPNSATNTPLIKSGNILESFIELRDLGSAISKQSKESMVSGDFVNGLEKVKEILKELNEKVDLIDISIKTIIENEPRSRVFGNNDEGRVPVLTRPRRFRKSKAKNRDNQLRSSYESLVNNNNINNSNNNGCGNNSEELKKQVDNLNNKKRKIGSELKQCTSCGTTSSPEWRKGPAGIQSLCNACGLYFAKLLRREASLSLKPEKSVVTVKDLLCAKDQKTQVNSQLTSFLNSIEQNQLMLNQQNQSQQVQHQSNNQSNDN